MTDIYSFYILLPAAFLIGACLGSFVSVASYRLPRGEEIIFKPSHCPHCAAVLTARDLVPLLSWMAERGRCRHCKAPVSLRYPLIEMALGATFAGLFMAYGLTFHTFLLALLATELAILIVTDLEHTIIPDSVQTALFFTGIVYNLWLNADMGEVFVRAMMGLIFGLSLLFGYKWLRHTDGLGWADVKFFCVAGIWLPLYPFVTFLFIAGVLGTLTGLVWTRITGEKLFPFGPAIAVSLFINVLFPHMLEQLF